MSKKKIMHIMIKLFYTFNVKTRKCYEKNNPAFYIFFFYNKL